MSTSVDIKYKRDLQDIDIGMNFLIKSLKISDHPAPEDQGRGQVQLQVGRLGRVLHLQHNQAQDQNELENIRCCLNMLLERNLISITE